MKILVTGANGYIGSMVVKNLLDMGQTVIATDFKGDHIDPRAIYIEANIFEEKDCYNKFMRPDVCLHLAWRDGFIHNSLAHIQDLSNHFTFLTQLIDSGLSQLAVMGSMHEIGYHEGKIDDTTPTNPKTFYGIAKDSLRKSLEIYTAGKKVVFQWLRAFYIYGNDTYGNSIFCKLRKASLEGLEKFPFTTGKNQFDFLSITELVEQISLAITQKSVEGTINICSGKPVALKNQIEWYIKTNDLHIELDYGKFPERVTESPCIYGDNTKIEHIKALKSQKVLVTGAKGQLGSSCVAELKSRGYTNVLGIDLEDLDLTDEAAVYDFVRKYNPNIILHPAAWTQVDKAEECYDKVYAINALAPKYLATIASEIHAKMVFISTDYVFDGKGDTPFEIDSPKKGLSVYGQTKAIGEDFVMNALREHFIVRISWGIGNGGNFVRTMLKLADMGKEEISVVSDQIGSITYMPDLAVLLCDMIETEKYGIYHATNEGYHSWYDLAKLTFEMTGKNVLVHPVTTEEYLKKIPQQAKRPLNSRMSKKSLDENGFNRLPEWRDALTRYLKENN